MKTIKEIRKELLVSKEIIEENLERLKRLEDEEESVTLRIQYETEREETITIPQSSLYVPQVGSLYMEGPYGSWAISTRTTGPLAGKAFRLNDEFDWKIGKDKKNVLCLVPLKKQK